MVLKSPQLFCARLCWCSLWLNPIIAPELQGISCQWLHLHAQHTLSNAHVLTKTMTMTIMSSCRWLGLMLQFPSSRNTCSIKGNTHSFAFALSCIAFILRYSAFLHFNLMTTLSLLHMLNSGRQECRRWQVFHASATATKQGVCRERRQMQKHNVLAGRWSHIRLILEYCCMR